MSWIETRSAALRRCIAAVRRGGAILLQGLAAAGCIMAALGAGMNRNPIISIAMLGAAVFCFARMMKDIRANPTSS